MRRKEARLGLGGIWSDRTEERHGPRPCPRCVQVRAGSRFQCRVPTLAREEIRHSLLDITHQGQHVALVQANSHFYQKPHGRVWPPIGVGWKRSGRSPGLWLFAQVAPFRRLSCQWRIRFYFSMEISLHSPHLITIHPFFIHYPLSIHLSRRGIYNLPAIVLESVFPVDLPP